MALTTASCKAKGRRLQQEVARAILQKFPCLHESDVRPTSMGAPGEDIALSLAARKILPISIECKNQQTLNLWGSMLQCKANIPKTCAFEINPTLVIKKNHKPMLVVLEFDHWLDLYSQLYNQM